MAEAEWDIKPIVPNGTVVAQIDQTGRAEAVGENYNDDGKGGSALTAFTRVPLGPWSQGSPIAQRPIPFSPDQFITQVANGRGDIAILARRGASDLVVYGRVSGTQRPPQVVTNRDAGALPVIQMNEAGDVLVAWGSAGEVRAAVRSPDGTWADAVTLGSASAKDDFAFDAALNEAGDAIVIWERRQGSKDPLQSAQHVARGRWSKSRAFGGRESPVGIDVELDATGDAVVTWHAAKPVIQRVTQKRWSSITWNSSRALHSGATLLDTDLGIDAVGNAVIIATARTTRAWRRTPMGTWVAQPYPGQGYARLAVNSLGRAVSVFGCEGGLETSVMRLPGGSWTSAGRLTSSVAACGPHEPKLNDSGDALVTWLEPQSNLSNPAFAAVLNGPATAEIRSLASFGRILNADLSVPGRLLVTIRRPTSRHVAAAFFAAPRTSGTARITIPTVAKGRRLSGSYIATVDTGSRSSDTRKRAVRVKMPTR